MYTLYIYSKCSTCQKALAFLEEHKVPFIKKEITLTPPSLAELKKMLAFYKSALRKLFNTSGLLYKELGLSQKLGSLSEEEALKLLRNNGMLVKRPFIIGTEKGLLGFKEKEWLTLN